MVARDHLGLRKRASSVKSEPTAAVVVEAWRLELNEGHLKIALGYFALKVLLLYPPHAIVMRLHGCGSYVVILIPETEDLLGL